MTMPLNESIVCALCVCVCGGGGGGVGGATGGRGGGVSNLSFNFVYRIHLTVLFLKT